MRLPPVLTHNYDPEAPFLANLCDLTEEAAEIVLDRIRASGRRKVSASYLRRRRKTEAWLMERRTRLIGATPLARPLYCFLGDFADGLDASRPSSLVIPLELFPAEVLTFTYPDSMASLPLATKNEFSARRRPFHGQVFTLAGIKEVVARHGLPEKKVALGAGGPSDGFIEAQVWDDRPIRSFLDHRPRGQLI